VCGDGEEGDKQWIRVVRPYIFEKEWKEEDQAQDAPN
jgi:hypothetical protein